MEATHRNGQVSNGEPTIEAGVKTTVREKITTTWQSLNTKKLIAVATVGTALVAGVLYVAQRYWEQKK
jgi:hypothetical protein